MARSIYQNFAHLVFSTKERKAMINAALESDLHAYLGGIVRELKGAPIRINGMPDHVHLLIEVPRTKAPADLMRVLKTNSSRWVKEAFRGFEAFAWQEGYGWFGVSKSELSRVADYIDRQKEHHREREFKDEFRALLEERHIDCDERFLWD